MQIRKGAWAVTLAAIGLTTASCTGSSTHTTSPSVGPPTDTHLPTTPSAAPTPTATTPTEPIATPEMAEPSAAGAAAAARYFIELYSYAMATRDLETWRALSADDCKFCNKVIGMVDELAAKQHTVTAESLVFPNATGAEIAPGKSYGANLDVDQGRWSELDTSGQVVNGGPASSVHMYFALAWQDGGWLVRQVDVHEPTS